MEASSTVRGIVWYGGVLCLWTLVVGVLLLIVLGSGLRSLAARGAYPPCWWLASNLTVVQVVLATLVVPLNLATESLGSWPFDGGLCRAWLLLRVLLIAESSWTVFAVTLDRFFRHVTPLSYARCVRCPSMTFLAIAGTWAVAGTVTGVTARSLQVGETEGPSTVLEEFCATSLSFDHSLFITLTSFAVPSTLVLVLLLAVATAACASSCCSLPTEAEAIPRPSLSGPSSLFYAAREDDDNSSSSWTYSGTYSATSVGLCFLLGWAPFFTVNVIVHVCQGSVCVDPAVWTLLVWVGYSTAGLMPLCWFLDPWVRGQAYQLLHRSPSKVASYGGRKGRRRRRRRKSGDESVSSASDSIASKKCSEVSFL